MFMTCSSTVLFVRIRVMPLEDQLLRLTSVRIPRLFLLKFNVTS